MCDGDRGSALQEDELWMDVVTATQNVRVLSATELCT